jgi:glycosyltransferase involved in cell wall biosynthesis
VTKLTVTVITHNEGSSIAAALESVSWADEIIVLDSHSTDETAAIARRYTPHVEVLDWLGYGPQKNIAADRASHDWILSIDADERITPELAREIQALLQAGPPAQGYRLPRVSFYLGRWIRSTDWYPDLHLRLYDRRAGRWSDRRIHESVAVDGRVEDLRGEMLHYPYRDISEHLAKIDRYTTLAAEQWAAEGRRVTALQAFIFPRLAFFRNYFLRRGFLDGQTGLLVSLLNSYYVFLKYAKLLERQQQKGGSHPADSLSAPVSDPAPRAASPGPGALDSPSSHPNAHAVDRRSSDRGRR